MKQGWFQRNFGWIADDFRRMIEALSYRDTWIGLGMILLFGILIYVGFQYSIKTDSVVRFMRNQSLSCGGLNNTKIIILFFGTVFFGFSLMIAFGEFARYAELKQRSAHRQSRNAGVLAVAWGLFSFCLGAVLIFILSNTCV